MASSPSTTITNHLYYYLFITVLSLLFLTTSPSSVLEDLNNLKPPTDFNTTLTTNCLINPSIRYCNSNRTTPLDLHEIFNYTIVASHLCNISNNTNCVESFLKIDLHGQRELAPLYLSFAFFWKYCPVTLISIDLSDNSLTGNFPNEIFKCSQIRAVDLSHNKLSGDLHAKSFSLLPDLTHLNLSYNDFSEVKDNETRAFFLERFDPSGFISSGLFPDHKEFRLKTVLLLVGLPFLVIVMVVFLALLCFQKPETSDHGLSQSCLEEATDHFSSANLVEKRERFSIYKGVMSNGREVRIETYFHDMSGEDRTRFVERCNVLVHLRHNNIVTVIGWCDGDRFRAVVSEWRSGDSVEKWLLASNPTWKRRVDVILRVADAVSYLHGECDPRVVCNLKTRNVLLSEDGEPVITRLKLDDQRSNQKNIFRFGMFVLEMVTDMRPMENSDMKETGFIEWLKLHFPDKLDELIDEKMKTTREIVSRAEEVIKLGLVCTDVYTCHPELRWDQVFRLLQDILRRSHDVDADEV